MAGSSEFPPTDPDLAARLSVAADASYEVLDALATRNAVRARVFGRTQGTTFGRYEQVTREDSGGMGVVYRAYDPQLDRPVAIKVLRAGTARRVAAIRAEARVLARLSHPNIVQVFDVAEEEGEPLLVMEYVQGASVARWLGTNPDRRAVVDVLIQAGRGIAAAHAAGVLHRDIKPANLLVGTDGRVRVIDFGLARSSQPGTPATGEGGTPGYIAPECLTAGEPSQASDQYSFAATAWRALTGELPHGQPSRAESRTREQRVLRRALSPDPDARYPSLEALVQALQSSGRRSRSAWLIAVALGAAAVGLSAAAPTAPRCSDDNRAQLWTAVRGARIADVMSAADLPGGKTEVDAVVTELERHAGSLQTQWRAECPLQDASSNASAEWTCLQRDFAELDAVAASLERGKTRTLSRARQSVAQLVADDGCAHRAVLGSVEHTRRMVAVRAASKAGHHELATQRGAAALADAENAYEIEDATIELAMAKLAAFELDAAHSLLQGAFFDATAHEGHAELALRAALGLLRVSTEAGERDAAAQWQRHAETWIVRAPSAQARAKLHRARVRVAEQLGTPEDTRKAVDQALPEVSRDSPNLEPVLLRARGMAQLNLGLHESGVASLQRSVELNRERLGPSHPSLATTLIDLADGHRAMDNHDRAQAVLEEALTIRRALYGPKHPGVVVVMLSLATIESEVGDLDRAVEDLALATALLEEALGRDHPQTSVAYLNLGSAHARAGQWEEALKAGRIALDAAETTLAPTHPVVTASMDVTGFAMCKTGRRREGLAMLDRALVLTEQGSGRETPAYRASLESLESCQQLEDDDSGRG